VARLVLSLVAVVLAGACYGPEIRDCAIQCAANSACPDGLTCVASMCRSEGETMPCGVEGERCGVGGCEMTETIHETPESCPADCGSTMPHCGGFRLMSDEFDGVSDALWSPVAAGPGTVTEIGGRLVLAPGAGGAAGYLSGLFHDLREGRVEIEIDRMVETNTDAIAQLLLGSADGGVLAISQQRGELLLGYADPLITIPYDPVAHQHWRIRANDGFVFWETSPDGRDWTIHASNKAPYDLSRMRLYPFTISTEEAGTFEIAKLVGGDGMAGYCPASEMDFQFATLPSVVDVAENGGECMVIPSNDQLLLRASQASTCYGNFGTAYDLRGGGSVVFEIAESTTNGRIDVGHRVSLLYDTRNYLTLYHVGDYLGSDLVVDNVSSPKILPVYTALPQAWRISEQPGQLVIEVSINGAPFTRVDTRAWSTDKAARMYASVLTTAGNSSPTPPGDFRIASIKGY